MIIGTSGNYMKDERGLNQCPHCGKLEDETPELEFLGEGPPPSYRYTCGYCAASGPWGYGKTRGDDEGAKEQARIRWNELGDRIHEALKSAVSAIYFADNSDYGTALWEIVAKLDPKLCILRHYVSLRTTKARFFQIAPT